MAEPVVLDPGAYRGTYKLIGGALCLDFANLVSYRGTEREHDWLSPSQNLTVWQAAAAIATATAGPLPEARALRELVARAFLAVADAQRPNAADLERVGAAAAAARERSRLTLPPDASSAVWSTAGLDVVDLVAVDAVRVLTSAELIDRVRACPGCRWVFLDTSRNRHRQWCDPADCGNRARQRRHYAAARGRDDRPRPPGSRVTEAS